ncbi:hypothetical protein ACFVFQ_00830 [Streptomyces sp. NPDC057743]|uniref:hypothetical protein n=1 Tax=Streptomyces sp. NPDC057743 TaxID=3346236 RepID=UPI003684119D
MRLLNQPNRLHQLPRPRTESDRHRDRPAVRGHRCPRVRLALHDGTERTYLLETPDNCTDCPGPQTCYEPRVHLAYLLARQGHDAHWLADFADLPLAAADRLTEAAATPRDRV